MPKNGNHPNKNQSFGHDQNFGKVHFGHNPNTPQHRVAFPSLCGRPRAHVATEPPRRPCRYRRRGRIRAAPTPLLPPQSPTCPFSPSSISPSLSRSPPLLNRRRRRHGCAITAATGHPAPRLHVHETRRPRLHPLHQLEREGSHHREPDDSFFLLLPSSSPMPIHRRWSSPSPLTHTYRLTVSSRVAYPSLRLLHIAAAAAFSAPEHLAADELVAIAIAAVTLA